MDLFSNKRLWMPDILSDAFRRGGDSVFSIYQHADGSREEVTYRTIEEQGLLLLETLKRAGLGKGDRLGIISAMRPWWYSILYAALLGGFRMVCIDPGIQPDHIRSMLLETEVRAVFTTLPSIRLPKDYENRIPVYTVEKDFPLLGSCCAADTLLGEASSLPDDAFFILFSSGTTGERRKGVLLPHTSITTAITYGTSTDAGIYRKHPAYSVRSRDLMLFPPYHIAGLLCAVFDLYCNTQIVLLERLTPTALSSALQDLKPDNMCTVPSMLTMLMKKMKAGLSKSKPAALFTGLLLHLSGFLRRSFGWKAGRKLLAFMNRKALGGKMDGFMIGGSPCDPETMQFFLDMGIDVSLAYGLTELGAPLAVTGKGYYPLGTGRVLRHTPSMDIRIVNPDEKGRGDVEILSPYRMISYLNREDNEGCFTDDGYFRSGDLGYFDSRDCLIICGRSKESIVFRNGEKLLPEEIEEYYRDVKDVGELSVFRVPDEGGCDTFSIAAVKEAAKAGLPDEVVRMHILDRAAQLTGNYVPKDVYILKELPYSSSHKVQRFRLTDMAVRGLDTPLSDASFRAVDEIEEVRKLRELLVRHGGPQWKTADLAEGTPLALESLPLMELFVDIQDQFGLDLFALSSVPSTFGQLLDAVSNYNLQEKTGTERLDLSAYPLPVSQTERTVYGGVKDLVRMIYHVHSSGRDHIPQDRNVIYCSNHISALDPGFILSCLSREQCAHTAIVGKAELLSDPVLKGFVKSQNIIPVDRTGNSLETLDRCRELLREGWSILIFPEGTNYENATQMLHFREGPARLAIATGVPVLPVHIKGVQRVDSNVRKLLPPVSKRIDVVFGEPFTADGRSPSQLNDLLSRAIASL